MRLLHPVNFYLVLCFAVMPLVWAQTLPTPLQSAECDPSDAIHNVAAVSAISNIAPFARGVCQNRAAMAYVIPDANRAITRQSQVRYDPKCPAGMMYMAPTSCHGVRSTPSVTHGFCMDRFEGSVVLESEPVAGQPVVTTPQSPFVDPVAPRGTRAVAVSVPGVVPQTHISGSAARQICENSGKRLCVATEWRRACLGPRWFCGQDQCYLRDSRNFRACQNYNNSMRDRCNHGYETREAHPAASLLEFYRRLDPPTGQLRPNPSYLSLITRDYCINRQPESVWATGNVGLQSGTASASLGSGTGGANCSCRTEEGVCDLVGNVHEWTGDASEHGFLGGYYADTQINGLGCLYTTRGRHAFTYHDYSTGFRCCADAVTP